MRDMSMNIEQTEEENADTCRPLLILEASGGKALLSTVPNTAMGSLIAFARSVESESAAGRAFQNRTGGSSIVLDGSFLSFQKAPRKLGRRTRLLWRIN